MLEKDVGAKVRKYFAKKREQLLSERDQAICGHPGLNGSHREQFQQRFLREILPKRFQIDSGMIYSPVSRSLETDIVIWDAQNYPCLPMHGHAFFFAESVRAAIECKSDWSKAALDDVLRKTAEVRSASPLGVMNLEDTVNQLLADVHAMKYGMSHSGMLKAPPKIGTAAIFLSGGGDFANSYSKYIDPDTAENNWPDVMLLLEPGHVAIRRYEYSEAGQIIAEWIELYEAGSDCLLMFTTELLSKVMDRVVLVESPLNLWTYSGDLGELQPFARVEIKCRLLFPQTNVLWQPYDDDELNDTG